MTCPSELTLAMHADRAVDGADAAEIEQHLADCERCRTRITNLREESRMIAVALAFDPGIVAVPAFMRPITVGTVLAGTAATLLLAGALSGLLALLRALLPAMPAWFDPLDTGSVASLLVRSGVFLAERGDSILRSLAETAASAAIVLALAWLASRLHKHIRGGPFVAAAVLCAATLQPMRSEALEIRHEEKGTVFVRADETVNDTLIAFGDTIEVDGHVTGDLIAFGRRVVVAGDVGGFVVAGAQSVSIGGTVAGSVLAGAETLDISASRIGQNLYAGAESVTVNEHASIEQNVVVGAENARLVGRIGRDALAAAQELDVASSIGGTLTGLTRRMTILAPARIAGDVHATGIETKDHVIVSPGAVIGGQLVTKLAEHAERNRFLSAHFYLFQLLWIAAAFVTGFTLLALVPGLRRTSIDGAPDALRTGAIGIVALVATPIIAVLVCLTLIGIPLGLLALFLWGASIYLGQIVIAQLIGTRVVEAMAERREHFAVALVVGLLAVTLLTNLPFIGGLVGFLLTLLGLGLLVTFARDELDAARAEPG